LPAYTSYNREYNMKKFKVFNTDIGYEEIIEATNEEEAKIDGFTEVVSNASEYIEIEVEELKS
tara:strand:+ start:249 stop:437 length:189 start_codon:yes stop_codon:yes gene_type:complete